VRGPLGPLEALARPSPRQHLLLRLQRPPQQRLQQLLQHARASLARPPPLAVLARAASGQRGLRQRASSPVAPFSGTMTTTMQAQARASAGSEGAAVGWAPASSAAQRLPLLQLQRRLRPRLRPRPLLHPLPSRRRRHPV
jgi:hypothetical protein